MAATSDPKPETSTHDRDRAVRPTGAWNYALMPRWRPRPLPPRRPLPPATPGLLRPCCPRPAAAGNGDVVGIAI